LKYEIERKFLIKNELWRNESAESVLYRQGYLSNVKQRTVRIRTAGSRGYITIKGTGPGIKRTEFEYEIPRNDADELLDNVCEKPLIEKTRHKIQIENHIWEIDEFHGENSGLIIAEIELENENETFQKPSWIGEEVSHDIRYFNSNLYKNPYKNWKINR